MLTLCAFTFDKTSTLKDLTHPYINTYECTSAKLGDENLLEKYEYFIITFKDDKNLDFSSCTRVFHDYAPGTEESSG